MSTVDKKLAETLGSLINDIVEIWQSSNLGTSIIESTSVPQDKSKPDLSFLQNQEEARSSILSKFEANLYSRDVRLLHNDLRLATAAALIRLPIGSAEYVEIDHFYKFSADLILREGLRLGLLEEDVDANESKTKDEEEEEYASEFENEVLAGFHDIYTSLQESYGEAYYILTQNGPLFSSLNGKASLDTRDTSAPGPFKTTEILPYNPPASIASPQLGLVSPAISRVPHPAVPPTKMMSTFVHPINAGLPVAKWLQYDAFSSFAPFEDNSNVILDTSSASDVWFEKLGQAKLISEDEVKSEAKSLLKLLQEKAQNTENVDEKADENDHDIPVLSEVEKSVEEVATTKADKENIPSEDVEMQDAVDEKKKDNTEKELKADDESNFTANENNKEKESNVDADSSAVATAEAIQLAAKALEGANDTTGELEEDVEKVTESRDSTVTTLEEPVDLKEVFEWSPYSFIDDDELKAAENDSETELISRLILELQNMQRIRLATTTGKEYLISPVERRLAYKIQNLLARVVDDYSPKDIDLKISQDIPITQTTFPGVLPAPEPKPIAPVNSRLSGLTGSRGASRGRGRR